ncbi:hypothetical protein ACOME3_004527 [Neoechinorhynchus agilis]
MLVFGKIPDYPAIYISESKEGETAYSFTEENCLETVIQNIHLFNASVLSSLNEENDLNSAPAAGNEDMDANIKFAESRIIPTSTTSVSEMNHQQIVERPQCHNSNLNNERNKQEKKHKGRR